MILTSYLSLALAVSVNSFLIPGDVEAFTENHATPAALGDSEIKLDCSSCPYALNSERHGGHEWTNDVQSDLKMHFDTNGETLRLNGVPFYPIQAGIPPQLHVKQSKKDNEDTTFEAFPGDLRLSYSLEYEERKADDGNTLVTVVMTILALDGQMVKIDNVEIKSIKQADGKVSTSTITIVERRLVRLTSSKLILHSAVPVPADPNSLDAKCSNVLCRVFAKITSGINKAKAKVKTTCYKVKCLCVKCYKSITGAIKHTHHKKPIPALPVPHPVEDDTVRLPTHHKFRPGMFGGHSGHHAHHRKGFFHRMGHVMWSTVKIAFMPILIGIAFGMAASAIGMLVGQLVVTLWMKYRKTDQVVYIPVDTDEKSALPAYEDLPSQEPLVEKEGEENA